MHTKMLKERQTDNLHETLKMYVSMKKHSNQVVGGNEDKFNRLIVADCRSRNNFVQRRLRLTLADRLHFLLQHQIDEKELIVSLVTSPL